MFLMSFSSSGTLGLFAMMMPSYPLLFKLTIEFLTPGKRYKTGNRITARLSTIIAPVKIRPFQNVRRVFIYLLNLGI